MKNYILFIIFSLSCTGLSLPVNAQDDKALRVEIEAKSSSDAYQIIPFGEKGVLLFFQSNESADKTNNKWYFTLYDTNFKEKWSKEQLVPKDLKYLFFDNTGSHLYLYLENASTSYSKGNFQVLKIDIDNDSIQTYNSKNPLKSTVTGFKVINDVACLSGYTLPSRAGYCGQSCLTFTFLPFITGLNILRFQPFLLQYNMTYGTAKIISDPYQGQAYIENLTTDDKDSTFTVSIKNHIPRKKNAMYIDKFNTGGSKTSTLKVTTNNEKRKLNTAKLISVNEHEKILIGTYNTNTKGNRANPAFSGFSEGSTGIYFCNILDGEQKNISFYNFSVFKNFYSYLSDKSTLRMLKKAKKLERKGKEISFDYKLLVHDIIVRDSSYIMIAEAYYPEYHEVSYTSIDSYGNPVTVSYTVFDGYRYTNALVACFSKKGELLWDNSFEIWNILTFNLHERVKVMIDGEDIMLAYSNEGEIASKIIRGNAVIEGKEYTKIESKYNNDKLISDYNSDMEQWYGKYFISYGYQKIKNKQKDKSKRTVFYFNKIAFE